MKVKEVLNPHVTPFLEYFGCVGQDKWCWSSHGTAHTEFSWTLSSEPFSQENFFICLSLWRVSSSQVPKALYNCTS